MKLIPPILLLILCLISSNVFAIEDHQILVCNSYCSDSDKENMAITNRYARVSEITVVDDNNWTAKTYRIIDSSEPGQTIIDSWVISNPTEITTTLNDIKTLENSLIALSVSSRADAGIQNISPMTSVMKTGAVAKREYNVTIPVDRATSVTQMWDAGYYGSVQGYIYGRLIWPAFFSSIYDRIMSQTKSFTVITTFNDGSTINFEYKFAEKLLTTSFQKIDSTAQKDGQGYKPNGPSNYYNSPHDIDITQEGGGTTFTYTSVKTCSQYTVTSSDGGSWSGMLCYYVYAN